MMNRVITTLLPQLTFCTLLLASSACSSSVPVDTPLWSEYNIDNTGKHLFAYSVTTVIPQQPPYYDGTMPLEFISTFQPSAYDEGHRVVVKHEFDEWVTIFIHTDSRLEVGGIARGARTFDKSGQLLAEARFEEVGPEGVGAILEVHYNADGSVQFWGRSQIDLLGGYKTSEIETHGAKGTDYYFIWPVLYY